MPLCDNLTHTPTRPHAHPPTHQVAAEPRLSGVFHELSSAEGVEVYMRTPGALGLPLGAPIAWDTVRGWLAGWLGVSCLGCVPCWLAVWLRLRTLHILHAGHTRCGCQRARNVMLCDVHGSARLDRLV